MTSSERRQLVEEILWEAQKCRSTIIETCNRLSDFEANPENILGELNPRLAASNQLNLIDVCSRVLDGGREVQPIDLYNVLYLARQEDVLSLGFALRDKELPEPREALS